MNSAQLQLLKQNSKFTGARSLIVCFVHTALQILKDRTKRAVDFGLSDLFYCLTAKNHSNQLIFLFNVLVCISWQKNKFIQDL